MRRIVLILCVVATLFSFSACQKNCTHEVYEVKIIASEISNNFVGSDWQTVYTCDGKVISSGERWTVPLNTTKTVIIDATVLENDKWPDVGYNSLSVVLRDDFETSTTVTVTENRGRNKGNKSQWVITCKVELIKKLEQE